MINAVKIGGTKIRHNCGHCATMFQRVLSVVISTQSHAPQAEGRMRVCKVFGLNRTKMFHVKRFGTIGCFNRTKMFQRPRSAASTETLARPSGDRPERD